MNGAIADPLANTMSTPRDKRIVISGNNQNFFLFFRKPHKSLKKFITPPIIVTCTRYFSHHFSYLERRLEILRNKHVVSLQHD